MSDLKIDHVENDIAILNFYELTDKQKEDLNDYEGYEDSSFFIYRDYTYDLNNFMRFNYQIT